MSTLLVSNLIINEELVLINPFANNSAALSPTSDFFNVKYTLPYSTNTRQYNLLPLTSQGSIFPLTPMPSPTTLTSLGVCYEVKLYNSATDQYAALRLKSSQLSIDYTLPSASTSAYGYNVLPIITTQPTASSIPIPVSLISLEVTGLLKIHNTTLNNYVLFDLEQDYMRIRYTLPGGTDEYLYNIVPIVSSTLPAPPISDTIPTIIMGTLPTSIQEGSIATISYSFASPIQSYQQAYLLFSITPGINTISNSFFGLTGGIITITAGAYNPLSNYELSFTINYLCSTNLYTSPPIPVSETSGHVFPPSTYIPGRYELFRITYPGTAEPIMTSRLVFFNGNNAVYYICKEPGANVFIVPKVTNQVLELTQAERQHIKELPTSLFGTINVLTYDINTLTQRLIYLEGGNIHITIRNNNQLLIEPATITIGNGVLVLNKTYVNRPAQAVGYIDGSNLVIYYYELATTQTVAINTGAAGAYVVAGVVLFVHNQGRLCIFAVVNGYIAWADSDTLYLAVLPGNGYTQLTIIDTLVIDPITDVIMNIINLNGNLRVYHGDNTSLISHIWGEKFTVVGGVFSRVFRNEIELPLEMDMANRIGYTWDMASYISQNLLMCVGIPI